MKLFFGDRSEVETKVPYHESDAKGYFYLIKYQHCASKIEILLILNGTYFQEVITVEWTNIVVSEQYGKRRKPCDVSFPVRQCINVFIL